MNRAILVTMALLVILLGLMLSTVKVRSGASPDASASPMSRPQPVPGSLKSGAPPPAMTIAHAMPAVDGGMLTLPVAGASIAKIADSWGDARGDGTRGHQGTDIIAPGGSPVLAAAPGTIEKLYFSKGGGGISIYQRSDDGQWEYYYAHLSGYVPGLREGLRVGAGQQIAYVGDTGNAGAGNYHLHFGMSQMAAGEKWYQGTPVDPYPLLLAGRRKGG